MTDTTVTPNPIPAAVSQQFEDFRASLINQPQVRAAFDALVPRLIDALRDDFDAQADKDTAKIPLGGLAASLIKSAIDGEAERAKAEAHAWLDQNLPGAT